MTATGGRAAFACGLMLVLCGGCQSVRPQVQAALAAPSPGPATAIALASYTVACPDVLDLSVPGRPELTGLVPVEPDGAIGLPLGRLHVDGLTVTEVADHLASLAYEADALVRVAEHNSRQLFLFGPVAGHERVVPYQGPETVVELLRRVGGLTPQAELSQVHVVRPNVAVGRRPEVFPVDLDAILVQGDDRSNVVVQPSDHVYIGETLRSSLAKYLPW